MSQVIGTHAGERGTQAPQHHQGGPSSPVLGAVAGGVCVAGIVSIILGFIVRAHLPALVIGIIAFVIGMFAQMVSETRGQRILIVSGLVAAFVGGTLAIAHGGFG